MQCPLQVRTESEVVLYNRNQFCLSFTDLPSLADYTYDTENTTSLAEYDTVQQLRAVFAVCYTETAQVQQNSSLLLKAIIRIFREMCVQERGKAFTGIFYPAAILVSDLFILATIAVYLANKEQNINTVIKWWRRGVLERLQLDFSLNILPC